MGIFDGLEKTGINVSTAGLFDKKEPPKVRHEAPKAAPKAEAATEKDYLFMKTFDCPVCLSQFKNLCVKSNKARLVSTDKDTRPIYDGIEPLKYEALICTNCGYAVMNRYLGPLAPTQRKLIKEQISMNYVNNDPVKETYTYDESIERTTLALASAIVKNAKASEKAYICLKGGWLCRSYRQTLDETDPANADKINELEEKEKEFLDNAYDGFVAAMANENFPIAGMDECTLNYLIAEMAMERGDLSVSAKLVSSILQSYSATARIKDKARELKEELAQKIRASKS